MKTQNITIEKNATAYNLILGSYIDKNYNHDKFFFVWTRNGMTGEMVSWTKGDNLHVVSLCYKAANINRADMTGILSGIKNIFPDSIGEVCVPQDCGSYQ